MKRSILLLLAVCVIAGCEMNNEAQRQAKRDQDRAALMLADTQRERDNYKGQVDALRASINKANQGQQQAQTALSNSEAALAKAQTDMAALRANQSDAATLRQQLDQAQAQIREMKVQIDALKAELQKASIPAVPTPAADSAPGPVMNK
ncbi:MAG TPA: hypothetical protein VHD56_18455 [Tepidisphaeraceae bacterium]|nr:hypothetical protein [Tepidisphaeraceae bacterium]